MKAIILNSGIGKRMGELTKNKPKCLIEISKGETILSRQIKILLDNNINDILITTGPFEKKLREHLELEFPETKIKYVHNPCYASTNYIFSLLLTEEFIKEDIILMHGDLVFDGDVLKKLLYSDTQNTVLINKTIDLPVKDFKGKIEDGLIKKIGIDIFDENCYFLIPIYKLKKETFERWISEMKRFQKAGQLSVYAEDALNNILEEVKLYPTFIKNELCNEIDDINDLNNTLKILSAIEM